VSNENTAFFDKPKYTILNRYNIYLHLSLDFVMILGKKVLVDSLTRANVPQRLSVINFEIPGLQA